MRKSRYGWETVQSPIHCCDVTKLPYLFSGELCTSPLHCKLLFVYTVCCWCTGQCFSVLRTHKSDAVDGSSGRRYVTDQWHNVPLLRARTLDHTMMIQDLSNLIVSLGKKQKIKRRLHWLLGAWKNHGRFAGSIKWIDYDVGESKGGMENELWRR